MPAAGLAVRLRKQPAQGVRPRWETSCAALLSAVHSPFQTDPQCHRAGVNSHALANAYTSPA